MKIADVFFQALLDDGKLQVDAIKAGDKAGQGLGGSMSARLKTAIKTTAFTALAAGAAIATKGLTELNSITSEFAAATGASADEAAAAGKAINAMAGRNLQPMREIGEALTKVHTDLGLTGQAAEKTTESFLRYATATRQNATAAVAAFDDILDAWGLTAEDATAIMDKLVVAHQKFGGSIEENQAALAAMAPQLKALNLTIDDGIGLLDLFAASGLDAAAGQKALNAAIKNLPAGESLKDFIARLSTITDDGERARVAMDVFGTKAGAGLANAIRPGISSLDAFKISTNEAAGATDKAAGAIESAFGNQVALKIKAVGSQIIGVGQAIGPLGSALTGLISLGGALGLDKVIAKGWHAVAGSALVKGAAAAAGAALGAIYGAAVGAVSEVAEIVTEKWRELLNTAAVKAIAARAGTILGAIFGTATGLASKLGETVGELFAKLPFAPAVRAAVLASAIELGTLSGTAFAGAAAAAIAAAPLVVLTFTYRLLPFIEAPAANDLRANAAKNAEAFAAYQKGALVPVAQDVGKEVAGAYLDAALTTVSQQGGQLTKGMAQPFVAVGPEISKVVSSSIAAHVNWIKVAHDQANRAGAAVAQGIREKRQAVDQAWQDLIDALHNAMSPMKERAKLLGELASKELVKGLHSNDPAVRAQARATEQVIIDRLNELKPTARNIGKDGMESLRKAMKSKDPEIRRAAQAIYNTIQTHLPDKADGKRWGSAIGQGIYNGLQAWYYQIGAIVGKIAALMADFWRTGSPSKRGPLSLGGGPEGWARAWIQQMRAAVEAEMPGLNAAFGGLRAPAMAAAVPSLGARLPSMPGASPVVDAAPSQVWSVAAGAGDTYNIKVDLQGTPPARDPLGVARQLQRAAMTGTLRVKR